MDNIMYFCDKMHILSGVAATYLQQVSKYKSHYTAA
jgi:hypothetical protein